MAPLVLADVARLDWDKSGPMSRQLPEGRIVFLSRLSQERFELLLKGVQGLADGESLSLGGLNGHSSFWRDRMGYGLLFHDMG